MAEVDRFAAMLRNDRNNARRVRDLVAEVQALIPEIKAHITAGTEDALAQTKLDTSINRLNEAHRKLGSITNRP